MTEYEKAVNGKLFDAHSEEMIAIKHKAHELSREYGMLDEYDSRRAEIIDEILGSHGERISFMGPFFFNYGINTHIGSDFFANVNFSCLDDGPVTIGDHVMIGPNVSIMASSHPLIPEEREAMRYPDGHVGMSEYAPAITIGSHVWIACGAIICGGVTIGDGAVIGAGSVVTKDMPSGFLCAGVPCKPIRPITERDSMKCLL